MGGDLTANDTQRQRRDGAWRDSKRSRQRRQCVQHEWGERGEGNKSDVGMAVRGVEGEGGREGRGQVRACEAAKHTRREATRTMTRLR